MSKYIVLYATLIGVDFCEEGDIIELPDGTDRNFVARMQTIGAIAPYNGKTMLKQAIKTKKKMPKITRNQHLIKANTPRKTIKNRPRTTRTPMPKDLTKTAI